MTRLATIAALLCAGWSACKGPDYDSLRAPALTRVAICLGDMKLAQTGMILGCQEQVAGIPVEWVAGMIPDCGETDWFTGNPEVEKDIRGCYHSPLRLIEVSTIHFGEQQPFRYEDEIAQILRHEYVHAMADCLGLVSADHAPYLMRCGQ
jgi:hypothetical protein